MPPKDVKNPRPNNVQKPGSTVGIEVTFYTDPICCWSWAMQPHWQQLQQELQGSILSVKYKMAGLLPSWQQFNDNVNSIRKPVQMGPEWMHAKAITGALINDRIWITDPPASSFPACIAVKCAELQSAALAERYLYLIQEAVMVKGLNIAKTPVLLEMAAVLSKSYPAFNLFNFRNDLLGESAREAFRKDLQECKYLNVSRLPAIRFKVPGAHSMLLSGYQSYESLKAAWSKMQRPATEFPGFG